jgi:hypothetical protein
MRPLLPFALCLPLAVQAQEPPRPIQDNSFLVEEAYNQEAGVVQHITTWQRSRETREWSASFTQEWPVFSQKHQFSVTVPAQRLLADPAARAFNAGLGDVALNYRYQLLGDGDAPVAISPRVSVYLPTGSEARGLGRGAAAYEFQLPVSWAMTDRLVSHTNANAFTAPGAKDGLGAKADLSGWGVGQSLIWLAHPNFNVMLEWVHREDQVVAGPGRTAREKSTFLNPGIRWAHNFRSGLQIVPGIAFPIGVGPSRGEKGVFLYISFEHPFGRRR